MNGDWMVEVGWWEGDVDGRKKVDKDSLIKMVVNFKMIVRDWLWWWK